MIEELKYLKRFLRLNEILMLKIYISFDLFLLFVISFGIESQTY